MRGRGLFVVVDGPDAAGKTTQVARLARRLRRLGRRVVRVREPGGTRLGEALRRLLRDRTVPMSHDAEALLFVAARRELLGEVVEPALRRGAIVLADRGAPSTHAYQGVAGGVGEARVAALHRAFNALPAPDVVVVLDLPPEVARRRRRGNDRFETRGLGYARAVARAFRTYARRSGAVAVDARGTPAEVEARVWSAVAGALR